MNTRSRLPLALAGITALALTVTACATPAGSDEADATSDAATTVVVENAKPTLVLVEEDGETGYQEDTEIARESVEVELNPSAVVTFDIATLDTLDAIGAGDSVVGIPEIPLPEYLSAYADLPKVGTLFEPDYEAVAELEPDLIVTAARSTGAYDELSEIATTIDLTGTYAGTFNPEAGLVRAEQLGEIFEREEAAAAEVSAIEELVTTIQGEAEGTALVLSVSGGEYGAFGEGSRFGYFYDTLGYTPAVAAADLPGMEGSPHGDTVTNEFILAANPDWIFAFDRGAATGDASSAEETLGNELVAQTTAATEGQIVYLPASELYIVINGLTAMESVLASIHDVIAS